MNSLLESWIMVEFLSASNEIDAKNDKDLFELNKPNLEYISSKPDIKGYKIKAGIFRLAPVYNKLAEALNDHSFIDYNPNSLSYFCEFEIDRNEELQPDSICVSSFLWAVNQLKSGKKLKYWENDFQNFKLSLLGEISDLFKSGESIFRILGKLNSILVKYLEWNNWEEKTYFTPIKVTTDNVSNSLLNSFYTEDLTLIGKKPFSEYGRALQSYINQRNNFTKVDVQKQTDAVKEALTAKSIPQGSWASAYSLSLMQQFAVNHIVNSLSNNAGLFSVNGPPGTGKTTLLKDAIAAIIVKRAKLLAAFDNPDDAFIYSKEKYSISSNFSLLYYQPDSLICDDAIVVTSSNNAAVENISKELPKIDKDFIKKYGDYPQGIYFKEIGDMVFNEETWNCLSFALGNSKNRNAFKNIWEKWNDETKTFEKPLQQAIDNLDYTIEDWKRVKKEFNNLISEIEEKKYQLGKKENFLQKAELIQLLEKYNFNAETAYFELDDCDGDIKEGLEIAQKEKAEYERSFDREKELKPGFLHFLFNTKVVKSYKHKISDINHKIDEVAVRITEYERQQKEINNLKDKLSIYSNIKSEYKDKTPDFCFWKSAFTEFPSNAQEHSPWFNDELKEMSFKIFFKALELHSVFISLASKQIKANIGILVNHFNYKINVRKEHLKGVWNTLFLVIPVISTTFASVSNLFRGLDTESFGWLFIDEAGQAVPQAAVGAIYRSKRVVAVGDPLQIEPVVTLPPKVFENISKEKNISNDILNPLVSVQVFADNINKYGAYINDGQWIGSPLKIHRRCCEPMFRIANKVAYDNIMQNANKSQSVESIGGLYSRYDSITGKCTNKQFVPEQGIHAIQLINEYYKTLTDTSKFSLFVISPFKIIPSEFKKQIKDLLHPAIRKLLNGKIGTVHTFQGKEADIVLFMSGCDSTKEGAVKWADSKPNLLNVALTRAKKIFIAIGDKGLYSHTNYFSQMIKELDNNSKKYMNE